jgi:hypothetical protein
VGTCGAVVNHFPPVAPAPRSLSATAPIAGVHGTAGRTLAATVAAIRDARRTIVLLALSFGEVPVGARFGGLRGGSVDVTRKAAVLERFSYVPGVQVSGTIPIGLLLRDRGAAAHLVVGGSASARGRLRVSASRRVVGVLGGHHLSVRIPAPARRATTAATSRARAREWPDPSAPLPPSPLARIP